VYGADDDMADGCDGGVGAGDDTTGPEVATVTLADLEGAFAAVWEAGTACAGEAYFEEGEHAVLLEEVTEVLRMRCSGRGAADYFAAVGRLVLLSEVRSCVPAQATVCVCDCVCSGSMCVCAGA
jgi:hypothetical protein